MKTKPLLFRSIRNSRGQGLTEYLILIVLVAVVSIVATKSLGNTIKSKIQSARHHINSEVTFTESGSRSDLRDAGRGILEKVLGN